MREHLTNDDPNVRASAAKALGFMGTIPEDVLKELIDACSDDCVEVRVESVRALGRIGRTSKSIIDALKKGLEDEQESVQKAAIAAVAEMYVARSDIIVQLVKLANSKSFWVRVQAKETLCIIGWKNISTLTMLLRKSESQQWMTIARVLARTSRKGAEFVADPRRHHGAFQAMASGSEHAEMFEEAVARGLSTPSVSYPALFTVRALRLSSRRIILAVIRVLSNAKLAGFVRAYAAGALGMIGRNSKEARKSLEAAAGDKDPEISEEARRALKELVVPAEKTIR